jgi:hypothetical protein
VTSGLTARIRDKRNNNCGATALKTCNNSTATAKPNTHTMEELLEALFSM